MRISDWSSDVCSSDLQPQHVRPRALHIAQIIGVIDDARQIGVLEIDARPVMMRRADEGAGNEGGRGDGHLKRAIAVARLAAKPRFTICRRPAAVGGDRARVRPICPDRNGVVKGKSWYVRVELGGCGGLKKRKKE